MISFNLFSFTSCIIILSSLAITPTISFTFIPPPLLKLKLKPTSPSKTSLHALSGPLIPTLRLLGCGSSTPQTTLTNTDLQSVIDTTDSWIKTRTGISQRNVLTHDEKDGLKHLAINAAENAMKMANIIPSEISLVIICTSSPDDLFGDSASIASSLNIPRGVPCFDLTAACSGFLFGLVTAGQFLSNPYSNSSIKKVLVIGGDALSRWVDWNDRNTCILFGDGAGAVILGNDSNDESTTKAGSGIMGYALHSDGAGQGELKCGFESTPVNLPTLNKVGGTTTVSKGGYKSITMNGTEVYKFATREVPLVLSEALKKANIGTEDVDWLLLHQANIRIMETVAKKLNIPMAKVLTNLHKYGNTSAGSIPIALDEGVRSGKVRKGDVIACAGFGAGLSWGGSILKWGGPEFERSGGEVVDWNDDE